MAGNEAGTDTSTIESWQLEPVEFTQKYADDELPTREMAYALGVRGPELDRFPKREDLPEPKTYQQFDRFAVGQLLRTWARSYGFEPERADRDVHPNGTYFGVTYSHMTVSVRWGTDPRAGQMGVREGAREINHTLRFEERDFFDALFKELSTRE